MFNFFSTYQLQNIHLPTWAVAAFSISWNNEPIHQYY